MNEYKFSNHFPPKKDSISSQAENNEAMNLEDSYANLLKDADKLKLMLLAWNYQNSAAVRNGTSGPDLATMTNLWEQYQNALGISSVNKSADAGSPVSDLFEFKIASDFSQKVIKTSKNLIDQNLPFRPQSPSHSREDVNSPSDNKEEDEGSEDESDERMDHASYDPERLKAFNVIFGIILQIYFSNLSICRRCSFECSLTRTSTE